MPNKRFLFTASSIILFIYLWQSHRAIEINDDDWGIGWFMLNFVFTGCVLGAFARSIVLFRRWRKKENKKPIWSWKDSATVGILAFLLIGLYSFNISGVCISEKKKLSDAELISNFISRDKEQSKPKYSGYYKLEKETKRHKGFMGAYRRKISFIYSSYEDKYSMNSTTLNACGKSVGYGYKEGGFTEKQIEKHIKYYIKPK